MPDFDLEPYTAALRTHASSSGIYESTAGHGVLTSHGDGLAWWCYLDSIRPYAAGSGLATVSVVLTYKILTTLNSTTTEPQDSVDPMVANGAARLFGLYMGDFTLGGLVRNVDVMGAAGTRCELQAGWLTLPDGQRYRAMINTLPLVLNDLWPQAS